MLRVVTAGVSFRVGNCPGGILPTALGPGAALAVRGGTSVSICVCIFAILCIYTYVYIYTYMIRDILVYAWTIKGLWTHVYNYLAIKRGHHGSMTAIVVGKRCYIWVWTKNIDIGTWAFLKFDTGFLLTFDRAISEYGQAALQLS